MVAGDNPQSRSAEASEEKHAGKPLGRKRSKGDPTVPDSGIAIIVSAGIGAFVAVLADILQKDQASAILKLSQASTAILHLSPVYIIPLLVALAIGLCFIFDAGTKKRAFYLGASVLSIIMLAAPNADRGVPSLQTGLSTRVTERVAGGSRWFQLISPPLAYAKILAAGTPVRLELRLKTDDNKAVFQATVTLVDCPSQQIVGRSTFAGMVFSFYVNPGSYTIFLEAPGYSIEERRLEISSAQNPKSVEFRLHPAQVPVSIQRLSRVLRCK